MHVAGLISSVGPFVAICATSKRLTDSCPRVRARRAGRKQLRAALAEMPPKYQKLVIDYERYADPDDGERVFPLLLLNRRSTRTGADVISPYRIVGFSTVPYDKYVRRLRPCVCG